MQTLLKRPALTYGQLGDVALAVWHQAINPADTRALLDITRPRIASYDRRSAGLVIVLEPRALGRLDTEVRRATLEVFQLIRPVLRVAAGVVEGGGMWAGTFRLAANAVNLATGVDVQVFPNVHPACARVAQGMGVDAGALQAAVASARQ